jgi:serine/threonine-protein kinase HipA
MTSSDVADSTGRILVVILEGVPIGRVERDGRRLRLTYDDTYLDDPHATILSAAMAPPVRTHTDRWVTPWLWGLLPDNGDVLGRWGRQFGVSVSSPFGLLSTQIGHDCAGAVQLGAPDDVDALIGRTGAVEPLTDHEIATRLRALLADSTVWLGPGFTGQFSLGGAQAKTALHYDEVDGWGQPSGSVPTTHILKPAVAGLDGHDLNEHLCLSAARRCGLSAARTRIGVFEDQTAIVVDRYDRREVDGTIVRIHQEDICQALGVDPGRKYQSDGGPSPAAIAGLLRSIMPSEQADQAIRRLVDALAFNWIIAGTDAHAKNYSLLHSRSETRLAPLYDVASALPYDTSKGHKLKLAMRLGEEYRLLATDRRSTWTRVADEVGLPPADVAAQVVKLAGAATGAFAEVAADPAVVELGSDLPERLVEAVAERASACGRLMA